MKRGLVIVGVCLILLMTLGIVSAGWFSGYAVKVIDGSVKKYVREGKPFEFKFDGSEKEYTLNLLSSVGDPAEAKFKIGSETISVFEQSSATFKNYPVKIEFLKIIGRRWVKVMVSEVERSNCSGNICTLYEGDEIKGTSNGVIYTFTLKVLREGSEYQNNLNFDTDKGFGGGGTMETIGLDRTWGDQTTGKQTRIIYSSIEEGKVTFNFYYEDLSTTTSGGLSEISRGVFKNIGQCQVIRTGASDTTCEGICQDNGSLCLFGIAHLVVGNDVNDKSFEVSLDGLVSCNENIADRYGDVIKQEFRSEDYYVDVDSECLCC